MSRSGVRYAGDDIRLDIVAFCQICPTVVAHFFHADSLIGTGRIAVIYPEKCADFHLFSRHHQSFYAVRCYDVDFSRSQFFVVLISQILVSKRFKGEAVGIVLFSNDKRRSPIFVTRCINSLWCQKHQCE